ncbi:hypothetical protein LIER_14779 [Lithospermum erythrorhizon]|uniref:DUF4283 domain-containing protein n=1 Tax=Lithospermum erythrorhizon TaxID=34254 RepID=A0AAV3Q5L5_LITER
MLLEEADVVDGVVKCEASAYAKVHAPKLGFVSVKSFSLAMAKAWNYKDIRVSRVSGPILYVFFPSIKEKQRIMDNGPWYFDNQLIILRNWSRGSDPVEDTLMNDISFANVLVCQRGFLLNNMWCMVFGLKPPVRNHGLNLELKTNRETALSRLWIGKGRKGVCQDGGWGWDDYGVP